MGKGKMDIALCVIGASLIIVSSSMMPPIQGTEEIAKEESRINTQEADEGQCTGPICITEINLQCPPVVLFGSCDYYVLDGYPQGNMTQVNFPWGPWIELHNSGSEAIDLSNYYFGFIFADDEGREGNASIPICLDCDSDGDGVPGPGTLLPYMNNYSSDDDSFLIQPDSYAVIRALYTCYSVECGDYQGSSIYPTNVNDDSEFFRKNIQLHDSSGNVIQTILLHEAPPGKGTVGGTSDPEGNWRLEISHSSLVYSHMCSISDSFGNREGECFDRVVTSYGYSSGSGSWEKYETPITPWGGLYYWSWHYPQNYWDNYTDQDGNAIPCPECGSWISDMDVDGVADEADNCPSDVNLNQIDTDSDGIGDACDDDRDGDGTENEFDSFPDDEGESSDSDSDGVGDNSDQCNGYDDSIDFDQDGVIDGCDSFIDTDEDGDGVFSTFDLCSGTSASSDVNNGGCSSMQLDIDGDGVVDELDVCANGDDRVDEDSDGTPDDCDDIVDTDQDGVADIEDQCEGSNDLTDRDNDGIPDGCDSFVDRDNDGIPDATDICPGFDDSVDLDSDEIPDGCDNIVDSDLDGVADEGDRCEGHDDYIDEDRDFIPDGCDSFMQSQSTQKFAMGHLFASIAVMLVYVSIFSRNLERNRGGNYSGSERERRSRRLFESLDTDGDGVLSQEELEAAKGIEEGTFEKLDTDGDGELTQEEFDEFDDFDMDDI